MAKNPEPVVLELAPLPRQQMGPFLILGLDKDADKDQIEANWAQRVIWSRKNQYNIPLEDINWAREVINDPDRRVAADLTSLNPDTAEGVVAHLTERYGGQGTGVSWQPLDVEKPLADYRPATEIPDPGTVKAAVVVPEVPREVPAVALILERFLREPLDAWGVNFPKDTAV